MSERMTRSRKRQLDWTYGITVYNNNSGSTNDDFVTKHVKSSKNKKNEDAEQNDKSWDSNNIILEEKRQERDVSPEPNPIYYRKILTTATVHQSNVNE